MWGALSDERTGLSFTIAAGPRQRSHSRVRVPGNSRLRFETSYNSQGYGGSLVLVLVQLLLRLLLVLACYTRLSVGKHLNRGTEMNYYFCYSFFLLHYYRLCGLVVRIPSYRYRGPRLDCRRYQIFWQVVGLERSPLKLMRIIEELLEGK
jgi:hypothetical protein